MTLALAARVVRVEPCLRRLASAGLAESEARDDAAFELSYKAGMSEPLYRICQDDSKTDLLSVAQIDAAIRARRHRFDAWIQQDGQSEWIHLGRDTTFAPAFDAAWTTPLPDRLPSIGGATKALLAQHGVRSAFDIISRTVAATDADTDPFDRYKRPKNEIAKEIPGIGTSKWAVLRQWANEQTADVQWFAWRIRWEYLTQAQTLARTADEHVRVARKGEERARNAVDNAKPSDQPGFARRLEKKSRLRVEAERKAAEMQEVTRELEEMLAAHRSGDMAVESTSLAAVHSVYTRVVAAHTALRDAAEAAARRPRRASKQPPANERNKRIVERAILVVLWGVLLFGAVYAYFTWTSFWENDAGSLRGRWGR